MMKKIKFARRALPVVVKAEWSTFVAMTAGSLIYVIGVMWFTVPYRFPDSGVTGIAVLTSYIWHISPAWVVAAANVGLIIWARRELSSRLILWTIFGVIMTTALMKLLAMVPFPRVDERLLMAIIGGVIKGLGGGIVFRVGGSLGGLDIVTLTLRKRYGIEVGKYSFYFNLGILAVSSLVVGFENALFGLLGVYASGVTIDNTLASFDKRRLVYVVSRDLGEVVDFVTHELGRGATIIDAHGAFSGEDRPMLMCILSRRQAVDLKRFLSEHDPKAFMVVTDAAEVVGLGFKTWKQI